MRGLAHTRQALVRGGLGALGRVGKELGHGPDPVEELADRKVLIELEETRAQGDLKVVDRADFQARESILA